MRDERHICTAYCLSRVVDLDDEFVDPVGLAMVDRWREVGIYVAKGSGAFAWSCWYKLCCRGSYRYGLCRNGYKEVLRAGNQDNRTVPKICRGVTRFYSEMCDGTQQLSSSELCRGHLALTPNREGSMR